jgi:hypothetical protein
MVRMRYPGIVPANNPRSACKRMEAAIRAIVPAGTQVEVTPISDELALAQIGTARVRTAWAGEGWLGDVRALLHRMTSDVDVVVARRMSPGARTAASDRGLGWVDESGAAEISLPGLVISRSGREEPKAASTPRWTPSVIGTAEALLLGTRPTVAEVERATGLSAGAATNALGALTQLGLLTSDAARGRGSAREIVDRRELLTAYADAAIGATPKLSIRVGVLGDLVHELAALGTTWDSDGVAWAATGFAAAAALAPYITEVTGLDVFVDAPTPATLDWIVERSGLEPIDGGRLLLRPFPTPVTQRLSAAVSDLRLAPWPRVYADLRVAGVRGEEAAEHLFEVVGRV